MIILIFFLPWTCFLRVLYTKTTLFLRFKDFGRSYRRIFKLLEKIFIDRIELPVEEIEDFRRLIRQCQLRRLTDKLNSTLKSYYSYGKFLTCRLN